MRTQQQELMQEYLQRINQTRNDGEKEEELLKIINKEKNTTINLINTILTTILLVVVVGAIIDGKYVNKEIQVIETCNGQISPYITNTTQANNWLNTQLKNTQKTEETT